MRLFLASLIVLTILYIWDKEYNRSRLLYALDSIRLNISQSMFHYRG